MEALHYRTLERRISHIKLRTCRISYGEVGNSRGGGGFRSSERQVSATEGLNKLCGLQRGHHSMPRPLQVVT